MDEIVSKDATAVAPRKKRLSAPALRITVLILLGVLHLVGAFTLGVIVEDAFEPPSIEWRQYYGVARGMDSEGRFCIDNSKEGLRCAVPRLEGNPRFLLPEEGSAVRGGYAELPSDTSDLPEPSWLWVTKLACGWPGTEEATRCPRTPAP